MDYSFFENLIGPEFPSPMSSSTSGCGSSREHTSDNLSQKSETFLGNFFPGTFGNYPPTRRNVPENMANVSIDDEVSALLSRMDVQEDESSSIFTLPLESVGTSLQNLEISGGNYTASKVNSSFIPTVNGSGDVNAAAPAAEEDKSWKWEPLWLPKHKLPEYVLRQLQSNEPVRSRFEFPTLELGEDEEVPPPLLNIFCNRSYNLAGNLVFFTIQVHNLPRDVELDATNFEAVVTTPEDKEEACFVDNLENFMVSSFQGSFGAVKGGYYKVQVKMIIPMKLWSVVKNVSAQGGVVIGSLTIPVSRNYDEESKIDSVTLKCEYTMMEARNGFPPRPPAELSSIGKAHPRKFLPVTFRHKLWGLAAYQRTNTLYYTDRVSHEVICMHPGGQTLFKFGQYTYGWKEAGLLRPTGIACDNEYGRLVVADKDNHRICFFTGDGQYISSFGCKGYENGMFHYPWDVAVSPDGQHIIVADSRNKRVQLFDKFGNFLNKYSVYESNPFAHKTELDYPRGITFNETGKSIYLTDFNAHNVVTIPLDLSSHRKVVPEGNLCRPQGITVDWAGNLLIVDSRNHCIRHVSPTGDLISSITRIRNNVMDFPVNVAALTGGFIAVLDGNGKIHVF
ncbi:unnamed protein product [Orchesella dallaii]|uniref:SMP-30/Gluconolactonase/LRE-like region domain-containing protein n=1 Tax=Orchesella dallaii TaxID=48710 RepID=A0ABP1QD24_9HEXA